MDGYPHALRSARSRQANAHGFTLVVWGTAALAIRELGKTDRADVSAFTAGARVSISLIVGVAVALLLEVEFALTPRRAARGEDGHARSR